MTTPPTVSLVHKSPGGRIHINHVGEVDPGVPFDVPEDVAASLLEQSDLYSKAKTSKETS